MTEHDLEWLGGGRPLVEGLAARMGIVLGDLTVNRVVGRMPVQGNTQVLGLLHGGANVVLAETLGSIAAGLHAGPERIVLGLEVSAVHHRAVTEGYVNGVATPLQLGRSVTSHEIVISDDDGRRTCTARLTCLVRPRPEGPPYHKE